MARRSRRRGRRVWLVVLGAIVVLLMVGAVVLDGVARSYASNEIETKIRTALAVGPEVPVEVRVEGFSVLAQLVSGRLDRVDVSAADVTFGELTGSASLTASGVPIDTALPVTGLTAVFRVGGSTLQKLSSSLGGIPLTSVDIAGGAIRAQTELQVLPSVAVPVGLRLAPAAANGAIEFTPTDIEIGGASVSVAALKQRFGSLADRLLAPRSVCVAKYLPSAIVLQRAWVDREDLALSFAGSGIPLDGSTLGSRGACPAS